jgi:lysophospholipase L1-like esterase
VIEAAEAHRGLTVVDSLEGFADQEVEAVELSEDGLHPNRKGHEILATLVHRHLEPVVTGVKREGRSR